MGWAAAHTHLSIQPPLRGDWGPVCIGVFPRTLDLSMAFWLIQPWLNQTYLVCGKVYSKGSAHFGRVTNLLDRMYRKPVSQGVSTRHRKGKLDEATLQTAKTLDSNQWYGAKGLISFLVVRGSGKTLMCSIFWLLWCEYSRHGWFQASNVASGFRD